MTDESMDDLIGRSVERLLREKRTADRTLAAEPAGMDAETWQELVALGLVGPDSAGLSEREVVSVTRAIGHAGALVPYADCEGLSRWLAVAAGIETQPSELLGLLILDDAGPVSQDRSGNLRIATDGLRLPWGRFSRRTLLAFRWQGLPRVGMVPTADLRLDPTVNMAGEPLDRCTAPDVVPDGVTGVDEAHGPTALRQRAALLRSAAMLGAMQRIHEMTVAYAGDRRQFGRSLSQFQVIQAYLAEMTAELAATQAMLECCLLDPSDGPDAAAPDGAEVAALRIRAGLAAQRVATLGHQIHGAIGFTREYPLHLWSRRLWSWREEHGNDRWWRTRLGRQMIGSGAQAWRTRITG
ncbi:MAG TPA: acyl-CoA dehydrogenase family protein [Burkholderiaceae bacterium]|nr:acyl-CoA dehydrogenase family protein [Burkholderiaceae bacterium]